MNIPAEKESCGIRPDFINRKQLIARIIFAIMALFLASVVPTMEIAWVSGILMLTIYLFAFELVGVDVAAITVMVLLGLTSLFAPLMELEDHGTGWL